MIHDDGGLLLHALLGSVTGRMTDAKTPKGDTAAASTRPKRQRPDFLPPYIRVIK